MPEEPKELEPIKKHEEEEEQPSQLRKTTRVRIRSLQHLEVRYKFLSQVEQYQCDEIFAGHIVDLTKDGGMVEGPIPDPSWLPGIMEEEIYMGMNIMIPHEDPIKALGVIRWNKPVENASPGESRYAFGLQFAEIDAENKRALSKFLIGYQISRKRLLSLHQHMEKDADS